MGDMAAAKGLYHYTAPGDYTESEADALRLRLLPWICELNAMPIRQFHSSWLKSIDEWSDIATLASYPEALPDLSAYILKRYRLKPVWLHDFREFRHRLLLVQTEALNRIVFHLGLIIVSPYIRKLIDGQVIRAYREVLGEDAFEFSRKKSLFFNPGYLSKLIKVDPKEVTVERVHETVIKKGMMCMGLLFWEDDKSVRTRLAVKLPKEHARLIVSKAFEKGPQDKLVAFRDSLRKILFKLIKEIEPTWHTIFV